MYAELVLKAAGKDCRRLKLGVRGGLVELEDEYLPARMKGASSGGLGFSHRSIRQEVRDFRDQAGACKSFFNIVALEVE